MFTLTFRLLSETFVRRSLFTSSSGSCHGSNTHPAGKTAFYEPGRGQLHTEPHTRPISCHVTSLLWQELNKLLLTEVSDRDRNVNINKHCRVVSLDFGLQIFSFMFPLLCHKGDQNPPCETMFLGLLELSTRKQKLDPYSSFCRNFARQTDRQTHHATGSSVATVPISCIRCS